ncbi:MAG: ABC transporter ATP-binding protein [Myxococcaceae bacterium]|nr:ABC transporter ATP-binding protein [Myxococcaceae bacterium]
MSALLELESLAVRHGPTLLVDGLSLRLERGQVHALVGESGSGKTLSMLALLELLPAGLSASAARLSVDGADVAWGTRAHAALRGRTLAMMLQDPASALDPVMRVGRQIDEVLDLVKAAPARRDELLRAVGFPEPLTVAAQYPHQLSGGMRQRILLAACLAAGPKVLVADEPTTALDAALRGGVLALLRDLATKQGLGVLVITHDLDAARAIADEVTVLYAGRVVEQGPTRRCLTTPRHPYTSALLAARPGGVGLPVPIPGTIPPPGQWPAGCRFRPRCPGASATCDGQPPLSAGVACHHPLEPAP